MSLQIALQNQTTSSTAYAYITGTASNGDLFLLEADGKTAYYPASPSADGTALSANCAIPLGAPGNTVYATIPYLSGARLWFSVGSTLNFYLNPGPGLVEPSVTNSSDSNINKTWDFCEFTFNSSQLYANITYVDFVCLPISLTLTTSSGTQHVSGMPANGLTTVCNDLKSQTATDGWPWSSLIVGSNLRALSPNSYITTTPSAFSGLWGNYVSQAWAKYASSTLTVDTQAQWGTVTGKASGSTLSFGSGGSFAEPVAKDIFSCSTGPFAGGSAEQLNIGARLAASLNRSTLLSIASQPDGATPANYYQVSPTNHYARIVHSVNLDGRGYAFPYDDVTPTGGADQSGFVSGTPKTFTVAVGGSNATASLEEAAKRQQVVAQNAPPMGTLVGAQKGGATNAVTLSSLQRIVQMVMGMVGRLSCF